MPRRFGLIALVVVIALVTSGCHNRGGNGDRRSAKWKERADVARAGDQQTDVITADILRLRAWQTRDTMEAGIRYRELAPGRRLRFSITFTNPSGRAVLVELNPRVRRPHPPAETNVLGKRWPWMCHQAMGVIFYQADRMRVSVPRMCLHNPRQVEVKVVAQSWGPGGDVRTDEITRSIGRR